MKYLYQSSSIKNSVKQYLQSNFSSQENSGDLDHTDLTNIIRLVFVGHDYDHLDILNTIQLDNQQQIIDTFEIRTGFNLLEENYNHAFPLRTPEVQGAIATALFTDFITESYFLIKDIVTPEFKQQIYSLVDEVFEEIRDEEYSETPAYQEERSYRLYEATRAL